MNRVQRQSDGEGRTLVGPRAVRRNAAAMQFDDLFDNCQPQSEAAVAARGRIFRLAETIEYERQKVSRDTHATVAYVHFHVRVGAPERDFDLPTLGRKLDGVGEQVAEYLLQPAEVAEHGTGAGLQPLLDAYAFGVGDRANRVNGRGNDFRQGNWAWV